MAKNIKPQVPFMVVDSKTGQQYTHIKDLPPELLAKLESKLGKLKDENGDGIPDGVEGAFLKKAKMISINDQNYSNFDEMPIEAQQKIQQSLKGVGNWNQEMGNDLLENGVNISSGHSININGKEYSNIEELPGEAKSILQNTLGSLGDTDHNGIPDVVENTLLQAFKGLKGNQSNTSSVYQATTGEPIDHSAIAPIKIPTSDIHSEKWKFAAIILLLLAGGIYFGWESILEFF